MPVQYREAVAADTETLVQYNCLLALETEQKTLQRETVRQGVVTGLTLAPEVRYFVAESAGVVIGQLMLTREWSDWRNGWMSWLQSVYVTAEFRGQGVFRGLLEHAIDAVRLSDNPVCLRLYVEHENAGAMECYRRLAFQDSGYLVMERVLTSV